jgi:CubicO group peptidase (beta-lactamase class C family)
MKRSYLLLLPIFLALFTMCQPVADTNDQVLTNTKVDSLMTYMHEHGMFNGTILVSENGTITYKNALGLADRETGRELTTDSRFYLASVSKQFTTMGIMILKERGLLSYEDTLDKYFPEFPDYAKDVTIRHMMTHTSGIPDHYGLNAYKKGLTNNDVLELLIKQDKLDFTPGERYSYSNGGYVLLSMIVAKVSGSPFHVFMKENIFDPLGMENTLVYDESAPKVPNRAVGYNGMNALDDYEIFTTGAGGMYSTLDDLFTWDQALYTDQLVSEETLEEAYTAATLNNGESTTYGFGWGVNHDGEKLVVGHSGGMNGYRTYLRRYVNDKNSYMLLSNNGDAINMGAINNGLNAILSGKDFNLPPIPLTNVLLQEMEANGADAAILSAENRLKDEPDRYQADENAINALGYNLMQDDLDAALAVFKFNINLFPSASNVYDSYGEALLNKGDTALAIENYVKSVKLNPNNTNGIEILTEKLGIPKDQFLTEIDIDTEILDSYTGTYQMNPNFSFEIIREGGRMFIHPTGQQKSEIFPASQVRFYSKIVNAQLTFKTEEDGSVSGLTLHQGGDNWAPKVK